jgi:release factor glutamine methyltransferase
MIPLGLALRRAAAALEQAGIDSPGYEARLLAAHALGLPQSALLDRAMPVDPAGLEALLVRRAAREPMALILGHQGFWTLDFEVSAATLIPRADSETLIEAALAAFPDRASVRRVLDLGTGTGCLLLAALSEFPAAWGVGVDRSPAAAALAARNAGRNGLAGRTALLCADWASAMRGRFDLILSNPPYIESAAIAGLMPEVAAHEPASALDGGADGLDAYRALIPTLPALLAPGGAAVLEMGLGQAESLLNLSRAAGFESPGLRHDLGGVARALVLRAGAG